MTQNYRNNSLILKSDFNSYIIKLYTKNMKVVKTKC